MAQYGFRVGGPDGNGADLGELLVRKAPFQASLWIAGANSLGQLGNSTIIDSSVMVNPVGTNQPGYVSAGGFLHTAAIKTDGTLWLWGNDGYNQLGDGTSTNKSSPVQTIAGGTNWKQVAGGLRHTAAIKTDGTLWLWGDNYYGQLGDSTITAKSSPVQTITAGINWKQVACGRYHTAAIKTDGTLWLWGYNLLGNLGDSTNAYRSSPVQTIATGTNWNQVSCGRYYTAAIKDDGTLWSWGENASGSLGDSTNLTGRSSPVQTIAGGTNWKQLSCGYLHNAAIKTDGTLWTWGYNRYGNLGDSTITYRSSPVQTIAGGTNWKQVSCGYLHTATIKTDGTLWTWGLNTTGQLGDSTITNKSSPVHIIETGPAWTSVCATKFNTIGIAFLQ